MFVSMQSPVFVCVMEVVAVVLALACVSVLTAVSM